MNELEDNKELLFKNKRIRRVKYNGEWYYSIVDIIEILTESENPKRYWSDLKIKLINEGNESYDFIVQLKLLAKDGKNRETDCGNQETIFRIIQSVPSPNAEPFKRWFARLGVERVQEINDPSIAIERARQTYLKKGYTEEWVNARIKGIPIRNELTDEWRVRGVTETKDFSILTDEISKGTFGLTTKEHKNFKKLNDKQNLRDNMSPLELVLTSLAEVTTTELHKVNNSFGMKKLKIDAGDGGEIASQTRKNIENKLGKSIVTEETSKDFKNIKILDNK